MVEFGEKFYVNLYGKVAAKAKSLDQVREIIYNLPKYIPLTQMPSTIRAFFFHVLRLYLQINTWNICGNYWNMINMVFSRMKTATSQRSLLTKNMRRNACFMKWSAVARDQRGQVYCVQVVRARNLSCHVLNFENVVVIVVTIAFKYIFLSPNPLFTLFSRLRKSWWGLPLFS